jgi:hypothetical protein
MARPPIVYWRGMAGLYGSRTPRAGHQRRGGTVGNLDAGGSSAVRCHRRHGFGLNSRAPGDEEWDGREAPPMARSQYQLHAEVRQVLVRHWIDLDRVQFGCHRGTVRLSGELVHTRDSGWDPSMSIFESLRSGMMRIQDVRIVQFDFVNWARDANGSWVETQRRATVEAKHTGPLPDPIANGDHGNER